ncbi:lipopolysaccharide biosynthesis protein [Sphingomonas sp.]|jgi:O-antigen/teichoic acid export membrane protein|uniref:lipopolysaccharide biosynthesis protein n=1 Tax=Sphingomonas sp. TaxID=28214 RepID=UPI002D8094C1|nr:lipopolysaccharide biosynthesis protein [Sphingomonas sp.]HEU0044185.1 lipopolysaccharide biosynthesis protein [Sphingomonas sp.]
MDAALPPPNRAGESLAAKIRSAVIWRSGSQILAQIVQWGATFLVIRILQPADYGLYAMTGVVLGFLNLLNGYSLASGLIRAPEITRLQVRQLFGMLLVLNAVLALLQLAAAPLVAGFYRQPEVATMLRVQAALYLFTPFIALPYALLAREMDFAKQARVNILAALASAAAALGGALAGWGVWTLVWAPIVLFGVRAVGMTWAARSLVWPSFRFRGAGALARFGGVMAAGQVFWFAQSQADVLIAGRWFDAHAVGLYTTALFLTQIFQNKVVPPLNEVAFSAYARMQDEPGAVGRAFVTTAGAIMTAALPLYLGAAVTAEPLVLFALGEKWVGAVPVVQLLACAMPFMTLYVLMPPASDAIGQPGIGVRASMIGAVVLPFAYLVGVRWGLTGLAGAWLVAYPIMLAVLAARVLPAIQASPRALLAAIMPAVQAALAMAATVVLVDRLRPIESPGLRLLLLIGAGGTVYAGWMLAFSRETVRDLITLVRRR